MLAAEVRAHLAAGEARGTRAPACPRRSSCRTPATCIRDRSPRRPTRGSRADARRSGASCCSVPRTACRCAGSRCRRSRRSRRRSASRRRSTPRSTDALTLPQVVTSDAAHALEHSLEVQLPFLQACSGLSARAARRRRCDARRSRRGDRPAVGRTRDADRRELGSFALSPVCRRAQVSIARPATRSSRSRPTSTTSRPAARRRSTACSWPRGGAGLRPELLDLRNSGDTAGDKARVVGYASFAFAEPEPAERRRSHAHDSTAISAAPARRSRARRSAQSSAGRLRRTQPCGSRDPARPSSRCGAGELRGCIGSLEPQRPLGADVRENAVAAAFRDPRFPPLDRARVRDALVEVSLLVGRRAPRRPGRGRSPAQLRPGVDGADRSSSAATAHVPAAGLGSDPRAARVPGGAQAEGGLPPDFWSRR